jgi:hypothetical protein
MLPSCRGWACYFPYDILNLRAKGPVQTVVCSISLVDDIGGVKSKQQWSLVPKLLVANSAGSGGGSPRHQRVTNKLKSLNCVLKLQASNGSRRDCEIRVHLQALSSIRQVISIASARKHGPRCVATWSRRDSEASRPVSLLVNNSKLTTDEGRRAVAKHCCDRQTIEDGD